MLATVAQVLGVVAAALRIVTAALLLGGFWRALGHVATEARSRRRAWIPAAVAIVGWQAGIWLLARWGFFLAPGLGPIPVVPVAVVLPLAIALPVLARSRAVAATLDASPPGFLIRLQTYRVVGAVFLVQYALGRAPALFALPAGIGDVVVGLLAIPVASYVDSRRRYAFHAGIAWNALGVVDLVDALSLGALVARGLAGAAGGMPAIGEYPLVMIPAYTVPLSLILHGQSIRQLLRARRTRHAWRTTAADPGAALGVGATGS